MTQLAKIIMELTKEEMRRIFEKIMNRIKWLLNRDKYRGNYK
jgi:hypothetical protein